MTTAIIAALDALARGPLAAWLPGRRWSGGHGRSVASMALADAVILGPRGPVLALYDITWAGGSVERFVLPLGLTTEGREGTLATVTVGDFTVAVDDATNDPAFATALWRMVVTGTVIPTVRGGTVRGEGGDASLHREAPAVRAVDAEQSNTSWVIDGGTVLKLYRRVQPGPQPDAELGAYLTAAGFTSIARSQGSLVHAGADGSASTLAVAQAWVPNRGDAWSVVLAGLTEIARGRDDPTVLASEMAALGRITGAMHAALARATDAELRPAAMLPVDRAALIDRAEEHLDAIASSLRAGVDGLQPQAREAAARLCGDRATVLARMRAAVASLGDVATVRVHGDYHLGQVLATEGGYVVIDFEGEPTLPLAARRRRSCVLRDVSGMLRSFAYAAATAARDVGGAHATARTEAWERDARAGFLRAWRGAVAEAPLSLTPVDLPRALALFEADKALYEVVYELRHRPAWTAVPAAGALVAINALGG